MSQWGIRLGFLTFLIGKTKFSARTLEGKRDARTTEADLRHRQPPKGKVPLNLCLWHKLNYAQARGEFGEDLGASATCSAELILHIWKKVCHTAHIAHVGMGFGTMETHLHLHAYVSAGYMRLPRSQ